MNWPLFFLDLAIRGFLLASIAAFAVWKLRDRRRTVAAAFGLCSLLLLPATQLIPRWGPEFPGIAGAVEHITAAATASWGVPVAIWGTGFLLISAMLLPGWLKLREWRRGSVRATNMRIMAEAREAALTLGLNPVPEIRLSKERTMPSATGFWRGVVFLPQDAMKWTRDQLYMVLLHEMAHLKRRDPGMQALGHLACALHWFNPFVWMLHRTWLREREMATDALVLSTGVAPKGYAMHLVDIAEKFRTLMPRRILAAPMAGPGLEQRVRNILSWVPRPPGGRRSLAVATLLFAAGLVTAAATFFPRPLSPLPRTPVEIEVETRFTADPFPSEPGPQ